MKLINIKETDGWQIVLMHGREVAVKKLTTKEKEGIGMNRCHDCGGEAEYLIVELTQITERVKHNLNKELVPMGKAKVWRYCGYCCIGG